MLVHILLDVIIFNLKCFCPARNISQKNSGKKAGHFRDNIEKRKLFVDAVRKAIFINRVGADAVFKRIVLFFINYFIQMMKLIVSTIIPVILVFLLFHTSSVASQPLALEKVSMGYAGWYCMRCPVFSK